MESNIINLLNKFNAINKKEWVEGVSDYYSSVGLTFEKLLNKKVDSELFPDYEGIEIKCSQRFSRYPIGLFNKAFDGPNLFETNKILDKYGQCYVDSVKKYLFVNLKANENVLVNEKYYFKLNVSYLNKRIYVDIYDINNNLLDQPYIDFASIEDHLRIKLNTLAVIYASKKNISDQNYFRYYAIYCYKLKSTELVFRLIEENIVKLSIVCRADFSNSEKQKNKGIVFRISKDNLTRLFNKIVDYDADSNIISFDSNYYFKK